MSEHPARKVQQAPKGAILRTVQEGDGATVDHSEGCPCIDCECDRLENEVGEKEQESAAARAELGQLRAELRSMQKELTAQKNLTAKFRALWAQVPKDQKDVNSFCIHPKCAHCKKRTEYHVAFRGFVVGRLLAGLDNNDVIERVIEDGQLLARSADETFPDVMPEDVWNPGEKDAGGDKPGEG